MELVLCTVKRKETQAVSTDYSLLALQVLRLRLSPIVSQKNNHRVKEKVRRGGCNQQLYLHCTLYIPLHKNLMCTVCTSGQMLNCILSSQYFVQ